MIIKKYLQMDSAPKTKVEAAIGKMESEDMKKWALENLEILEKWLPLKEDAGWKKGDKSKDKLITCYSMTSEGRLTGKGEGTVHTTATKFITLMNNIDKRPLFDDMFHSGEVIEKFEDEENEVWAGLIHIRRKGMMMIKSRDILQASLKFKGDGDIWYSVAHSVESEKCPPIKDAVRAFAEFLIYELKPSEDGKSCYATKIFRFDPKGSIPDMIKKKILKKGGLELESIKNALLS